MRLVCLVGSCLFALACSSSAEETEGTQGGTSGTGSASAGSTTAPGEATGSPQPITAGSSSGESTGSAETTGDVSDTTSAPGETSSGGEESTTGPALPEGQWAITEITYTEAGQSETLTMQDRAFCDVTLEGGILLLRYQQQQGYTVWTINMPEAITVGEHALSQDFSGAYMNINEVSDAWQAYFDPASAVGTLTLTDAEIGPGGVVAGTLVSTMTSVDGTTTAEFSSTFYAEIP